MSIVIAWSKSSITSIAKQSISTNHHKKHTATRLIMKMSLGVTNYVRLLQVPRAVEYTPSYAYYACQLRPKTRKRLYHIPQSTPAYQSMIIIV